MNYGKYKKEGNLGWGPGTVKTATAYSDSINTGDAEGIRIDWEITALTGTSVTLTLQYYDDAKAAWRDSSLASAAQTGTGHVTLRLHPAITVVAASGGNAAASDLLPKKVRLALTGVALTSVTFGAAYTLN